MSALINKLTKNQSLVLDKCKQYATKNHLSGFDEFDTFDVIRDKDLKKAEFSFETISVNIDALVKKGYLRFLKHTKYRILK